MQAINPHAANPLSPSPAFGGGTSENGHRSSEVGNMQAINPHAANPLSPSQRLVEALQRMDIDRTTLAQEIEMQCRHLGALTDAVSAMLADLREARGTVRNFCAAMDRDDVGKCVLGRTANSLLVARVPCSLADDAQKAMEGQRERQRRRASGEELEDTERFSH